MFVSPSTIERFRRLVDYLRVRIGEPDDQVRSVVKCTILLQCNQRRENRTINFGDERDLVLVQLIAVFSMRVTLLECLQLRFQGRIGVIEAVVDVILPFVNRIAVVWFLRMFRREVRLTIERNNERRRIWLGTVVAGKYSVAVK